MRFGLGYGAANYQRHRFFGVAKNLNRIFD
jgi:hypothetical protein